MKHPILYRVGFYSCLIVLCAGILFLLNLINEAPFKSSDMRNAYAYGCEFGSRPLTDDKVASCFHNADVFKETLDDLDKQMEAINARKHHE